MMMMGWLRRAGKRDPLAALDDGPFHGGGAMYVMELVVQPTRVADGVTSLIAPPERSGGGAAVGADQRLAVHLVLVVSRATVAAGRPTRTVAVTVGGARPIASVMGRLGDRLLDGVALEPEWTGSISSLEVEATRVANRLSSRSSPPKRSRGRTTVRTDSRRDTLA